MLVRCVILIRSKAMPSSIPSPKTQPAKTPEPAKTQAKRVEPHKKKTKPQVISRQIFNDFASI
jgi:hypothetical protein